MRVLRTVECGESYDQFLIIDGEALNRIAPANETLDNNLMVARAGLHAADDIYRKVNIS